MPLERIPGRITEKGDVIGADRKVSDKERDMKTDDSQPWPRSVRLIRDRQSLQQDRWMMQVSVK